MTTPALPVLPVLIVGAGPTGLALGIELSRHGVPFRLIDRITQRSDKSRALAVQARTLELMRGWGVSEPLVARGNPTVQIQIIADARPAAQLTLSDIGVDDTPYPFVLFVSQHETEALLDEALRRLGGAWEPGVELLDAAEDELGVTATLRHADAATGPGSSEQLRVAYVIGCDGAHSCVRRLAGLTFAGAQYENDFILADVKIDWAAPQEQLQFFFGKRTTVVVFPLQKGLSRIVGIRSDGAASDAEPTLEEVRALLATVSPWPVTLSDPRWLTRFHLHHRGVDRYRRGRFLVAGDAAHIHSPAGGQGMNTGIQDAINLGWKLARVMQQRSPATLLDSYDEERRPVGERLLQYTDRLFAVANTKNPILSWARNKLVPFAAPRLLATPRRRALLFRFVSELGIHYRGSSIVTSDGGERAPDASIDGGHLLDRFASPTHHLLVSGDDDGGFARATRARFASELDIIPIADQPARARYRLGRAGWVLVRPDGYIAARAHALDDGALDSYFGSRIGPSASKRSI
jgi:2-polyprenyl-6-methoxyphenol hydroxylase-like FAD-dependent oxidoreductase